MSYEGYSQFLDTKGHYWTEDCYIIEEIETKNIRCPICGERAIWENMVNITNGSLDDEGNRIDGFIELKVKKKTSGTCSCCGKEHVCEITYQIPKKMKSEINWEKASKLLKKMKKPKPNSFRELKQKLKKK